MRFLLGLLFSALLAAGARAGDATTVHVVYTSEVRGTVGICG